MVYWLKEEFEDMKGEIRIRISKKNRQHNDQKLSCHNNVLALQCYVTYVITVMFKHINAILVKLIFLCIIARL